LTSFTRTIPAYKKPEEVEELLSREDNFIPLAYKPAQARAGDYIYLIYRGYIVGRARISGIEPVEADSLPGEGLDWARWLIRYRGGWQRPPRPIPAQGHQSVRYLGEKWFETLDGETW
jgi:hypothetical protein